MEKKKKLQYYKHVIVTSTMVDPQASRMHTAKKILSGCGGNDGKKNELITVTWKTKQEYIKFTKFFRLSTLV